MWLEVLKVLVTVLAAAVTAFGGGYFSYKKFVIERNDAKEKESTQKLIEDALKKSEEKMRKEIKESVQQGIVDCGEIGDKAILRVRDEFMESLAEGLKARGEEGQRRFDINSRQIELNSHQLAENSKQIEEILGIVKGQAEKYDMMADSLTTLNKVTAATAESQCNSNYDRLLLVTAKILKSQVMTISDKTNLKQLYESWKILGGKDLQMETKYEECMKLNPVLDE